MGLLNSRYLDWLYRNLVREIGRVFAQVKLSKIKQLPIRRINFADPTEKQQHDEIVALVEAMLELQKEYAEAERGKFRDKTDALKRRIAQVDAAIDAAVYRLYDLSEEEIRVVEGEKSK